MISRLSFSFKLLSKIMKLFVTSNEWIKLVWLGENTQLSSKFGVGIISVVKVLVTSSNGHTKKRCILKSHQFYTAFKRSL